MVAKHSLDLRTKQPRPRYKGVVLFQNLYSFSCGSRKSESYVKRCIIYSGRDMKLVIYIYKTLYILHPRFLMVLTKTEIPITATIPPMARLIDKIGYVSSDVF